MYSNSHLSAVLSKYSQAELSEKLKDFPDRELASALLEENHRLSGPREPSVETSLIHHMGAPFRKWLLSKTNQDFIESLETATKEGMGVGLEEYFIGEAAGFVENSPETDCFEMYFEEALEADDAFFEACSRAFSRTFSMILDEEGEDPSYCRGLLFRMLSAISPVSAAEAALAAGCAGEMLKKGAVEAKYAVEAALSKPELESGLDGDAFAEILKTFASDGAVKLALRSDFAGEMMREGLLSVEDIVGHLEKNPDATVLLDEGVFKSLEKDIEEGGEKRVHAHARIFEKARVGEKKKDDGTRDAERRYASAVAAVSERGGNDVFL